MLWLAVYQPGPADSLVLESQGPRRQSPCALGPRGKGIGVDHRVGSWSGWAGPSK